MLGIKLYADAVLDEKAVLQNNDAVVRKFLKMYGQDVRRAAKRMMKSGKKGKERSKPGEAPRNQTGVYKNLIQYGVSDDGKNVFIGPERFEGKSEGAKALEHGGMTTLTIRAARPPKAKRRKATRRKRKSKKHGP